MPSMWGHGEGTGMIIVSVIEDDNLMFEKGGV